MKKIIESINLLDYFTSLYDDSRWIKWKDFIGREKAGDQAQNALYPNLKLVETNTNTTSKVAHETKTGNESHQNQNNKGEHRNVNPNHHLAAHQRTGDHHVQRRLHSRGRGAGRHVGNQDGRPPRNASINEQ